MALVAGELSARFDLSASRGRETVMMAMTISFINKTLCFHLLCPAISCAFMDIPFGPVDYFTIRRAIIFDGFTLTKANNLICC